MTTIYIPIIDEKPFELSDFTPDTKISLNVNLCIKYEITSV